MAQTYSHQKDNETAKFNLEPLQLIKSKKFNASEIKEIRKLVEKKIQHTLYKNGMNTLMINKSFLATELSFKEDKMIVFLKTVESWLFLLNGFQNCEMQRKNN